VHPSILPGALPWQRQAIEALRSGRTDAREDALLFSVIVRGRPSSRHQARWFADVCRRVLG
jgi:hypothetical protein